MGLKFLGLTSTPGFDPRKISGITQWLDVSDSSTLFQAADATTGVFSNPVTSNGQTCKGVVDKSGNCNLGEFYSSSTYTTGAVNGHPVLHMDGASNWFTYPAGKVWSSIVTNSSFSMWWVISVPSTPAYDNLMSGTVYNNQVLIMDNNGELGITFRTTGPSVQLWSWDNSTQNGVEKVFTPGQYMIIHARMDSGYFYLSINGSSEVSIARNNTSYLGGTPSVNTAASGHHIQMNLAEMLCYNVAVGSSDRAKIQAYLNSKYAIY